ncbi:MAG: XRE family transcriptional regulator [Candidatus Omnitrophica bacterium]|nr:XRE family transcriptional regulator [Candidatus Omnitrophota bacterium]MBU1128822.1 XRE family transcriptional regulator [Candidatus Omnitrophota bacterium]MBU1783785.1 XRE family transcriptional regulator [Candidatus Omnitrophota bacterium]MBU1852122.1 XRE family transcriptional regulator [Candidatus Omnitrophota bacterium]
MMKIGEKLHNIRKEKNMTLEDLSKKSGVALATLSRMENNRMIGTLDAHNRICKALSASLADLYREIEDASKTVETVSEVARIDHFVHSKKVKYELLVAKTPDKKILPLMIKLAGGGKTREERNKTGTEKFLYVMTGSVNAVIGHKQYSLCQGDSLYFDASLSHVFHNRMKSDAKVICIISPA